MSSEGKSEADFHTRLCGVHIDEALLFEDDFDEDKKRDGGEDDRSGCEGQKAESLR